MKHTLYIILAACLFITASCSSDDSNGGQQKEAQLTNYAWGTSMSEVQKALANSGLEQEGNTLYAKTAKRGCVLSYEFSAGALSSMALVGPETTLSEQALKEYTKDYELLGALATDDQIYVNEAENRILKVQTIEQDGKTYRALGWTKLK